MSYAETAQTEGARAPDPHANAGADPETLTGAAHIGAALEHNAKGRDRQQELRQQAAAVRRAALGYIRRGWRVVPAPFRQKGPVTKGWQDLRITADGLDDHFPADEARNVGLILGAPSGGLVDVDLDCPEARAAAERLLPPTHLIHGRAGNPRSHRWYVVEDGAPEKGTTRFQDLDGRVLLEVRSTGGQTLAPPSVHPGGEPYRWEEEGESARLSAEPLLRAARVAAAAALLIRHWPKEGSRQEAAFALAGGLARAGWKEEDVENFVGVVAEGADDEESEKRRAPAARTVRRVRGRKKTTGLPTLVRLLGDKVVRRVCKWLGCREIARDPAAQDGDEGTAPSRKQADRLVALATGPDVELFHDPRHEPYAAVVTEGRRQTWALKSAAFQS